MQLEVFNVKKYEPPLDLSILLSVILSYGNCSHHTQWGRGEYAQIGSHKALRGECCEEGRPKCGLPVGCQMATYDDRHGKHIGVPDGSKMSPCEGEIIVIECGNDVVHQGQRTLSWSTSKGNMVS